MALAQQLIAPPGHLRTPQVGVGMPHSLPSSLGFGALNPGITTGSRYSGAGAPGGAMNLVHPATPETFQAPTYTAPTTGIAGPISSRAIAPIVAALMATGASAPAPASGATARGVPPPPPGLGAGPLAGAQQVPAFNYANPSRQQNPLGQVYEGHLPTPVNTSGLAAAFAQLAQSGGRPHGSNILL